LHSKQLPFSMETSDVHPVRMSRRALAGHIEGFLRSLRGKRPETRGTYQRALREFVRWFEQEKSFRFRVEDVERYKQHLTRRKKLSEVSVSTYLTAVRRFCEYLVHAGVLETNPARSVDGNKRPLQHSRAVLTPGDVERLLAAVERHDERGLRDFAVIRLMLDCALSEIEIIRANVNDLSHDEHGTVIAVQGKGRTKKDAVVTVPADVKEAIDEYVRRRTRISPEQPLFVSAGNRTRGRRMTTRGIRDRVNMYLERTGIKQGRLREVTPYSLRHTAAVLMADRGASADEIRARLRLGSVTTAMIYVKHNQRGGPDSGTQSPVN
jgi:integrase/recombinase XerC